MAGRADAAERRAGYLEAVADEELGRRLREFRLPNYGGACVPPYPPDVDCADIPNKNFRVIGSDPHRLDGGKAIYMNLHASVA